MHQILVGNSDKKKRYGCRQKDNIKKEFREIGCEGVNCTLLTQNKAHWLVFMSHHALYNQRISCPVK
jgi:hypothetical protein